MTIREGLKKLYAKIIGSELNGKTARALVEELAENYVAPNMKDYFTKDETIGEIISRTHEFIPGYYIAGSWDLDNGGRITVTSDFSATDLYTLCSGSGLVVVYNEDNSGQKLIIFVAVEENGVYNFEGISSKVAASGAILSGGFLWGARANAQDTVVFTSLS